MFPICFSYTPLSSWPVFAARLSDDVLEKELEWSASRQSSMSCGLAPKIDDPLCFIKTFTKNEYQFYMKYKRIAPGGLFSLNQNPDVKCVRTKRGEAGLKLTTLRVNAF